MSDCDFEISIDEPSVDKVIEGEVQEATDVGNPEIGIGVENQEPEEIPSPPPVDESVSVGEPGPPGPPGPAGSSFYDEFPVLATGQIEYGPLTHTPSSGDVFINGLQQSRSEFFFSSTTLFFNDGTGITAGDTIGVVYFY
jgi:hypothetical protein